MCRTTKLKLIYLFALVALGLAGWGVLYAFDYSIWVLAGTVLVLLIPGRVVGAVFRDLLRGRRFLQQGQAEESIRHTERFLAMIRAKPRRKPLIWLTGTIYTADVEAMALNNLGAAQLNLGRLDEAAARFNQALRVDPEYPMPFFNLAIISAARGEDEEAGRSFQEAVARGYTRSTLDRVIQTGQRL
jgi:tetratricopeptide (TPR) repeat protein